jgi:hypothetical protein
VSAYDDPDAMPRAMGQVPVTGRGSLPFLLLDGEPLVALASFALEDAGVELVDFDRDLADVSGLSRPLVIHDPLCPLTPTWFLQQAWETAVADDVVVVGVHAVTDTIKRAADGSVGDTVDRDSLWAVTSPVVLPASLLETLVAWPDADDLAALVGRLRERAEVRFLESPVLGRRIDDESSVVLLEALADQQR